MIRNATAAVLACAALVWSARLLWLGAPPLPEQEVQLGPWIDAECGALASRELDALEPSLAGAPAAAPSHASLELAQATLHEEVGGEPSPTAAALARFMDGAERLEIAVRWSRISPESDELEAEFHAEAPRAVPWWESLVRSGEEGSLTPSSCRWSLVSPLSAGAPAQVIGRLRFALASEPERAEEVR